jgi:sensor histidine kinase YesM
MTTNNNKSFISIGIHFLGWLLLGFMLIFYVPLTWKIEIPLCFWIWQCVVLTMMLSLFYINAKIIVPKTIINNKVSLFVLWIIIAILLTQLIAYFYTSYTDLFAKMARLLGDKRSRTRTFDNFVFSMTLLVLGISTSWALLQYWQKAAENKQQLEQDKIVSELAMLKAQINPHFFFNSLNSIYSLTYINVEDSRTALHTLSRMMRYLLYNTEGERTTLLKDVDFINNYIALMRLRANTKLQITTHIPPLIDYAIAPMLLLPLIENAFKHGVSGTGKSEIIITISQKNDVLSVTIENTIFEENGSKSDEGGIGLTNTKRRLQLLYPSKHSIQAGPNNQGRYIVNLEITLDK